MEFGARQKKQKPETKKGETKSRKGGVVIQCKTKKKVGGFYRFMVWWANGGGIT
jgi:hypothetical protein